MRIAVDVMGGDHGCGIVVEGVKLALQADPDLKEIHLVGQEEAIRAALAQTSLNDPRIKIVHASQVLAMDEKPVEGLRRKKDCSILRAVELLKEGQVEVVLSTGNTGGLVAAATIRLRPLPGVERPAIATVIPGDRNEFILIDGGATPECRPLHLLQFAIMGSIYSQEILGYENPRVGILSNGKEEIKGTDITREAAKLCRQIPLNFVGYVEGHDLFADEVEVVVTDGFVGNIVLKSIEGMGKAIVGLLRRELTANPLRKFGARLASGGLRRIKRRMNPDNYGGAPLLGLNGLVVKAHGSASPLAIMNAIHFASEAVTHQINEITARQVAVANQRLGAQFPLPA